MNGTIDWFARNTVAANLLMLFIIIGGFIATFNIRTELQPEVSLDRINIEVPYLGAAPSEVEQAVCVRVEEAIQGVDGVKQVTSTAAEGIGSILVELELNADLRRVLDDIKGRVDAIDTFPEETEKPIIREMTNRKRVMDLVVSGLADEFLLKAMAERVRDELSAIPEISQVEIISARPYEVAIEISELMLRRYGLTFDDISRAVQRSSLDLPGGTVRSDNGEILLRTIGQAYTGHEYEQIVVMTRGDGTRLLLGEVATVVDGFAETDQFARFDGEPTVLISIFRTGAEGTFEIAELVHDYVERTVETLPAGFSLTILQDESRELDAQFRLLLRNGFTGFALVFLVLALFLELRLAFWVSLGIPISFLGAIMLMPVMDLSLNRVSLFGFILVLGIVVDDAIIVGENIFTRQESDKNGLRGSIQGAQEIATPVSFAVLTTVAAFLPLMFVPGMMGKMFLGIPLIVIPCVLFSLIESLNILPAHLSHLPKHRTQWAWTRFQGVFTRGLKLFILRVYSPGLEFALRWRYFTATVGIATLVITVGAVLGGLLQFHFIPSIESESITVSVTMPQGTPVAVTSDALRRAENGADRLRTELFEETGRDYVEHVFTAVGDQPSGQRGPGGMFGPGPSGASAHLGEVTIELVPSGQRLYTSEQLGNRWREVTDPIPEAVEINFQSSEMDVGSDVDVMLVGPDMAQLSAAAEEVKEHLATYAGVYDVTDTFRLGKEELKLTIKPAAEALGLTLEDLGRQVRQAFYGEEAQRIQRGRDDVRVMVRYPAAERRSVGTLETMRIRTPDGGEVPFRQVATVEVGRSFASIKRIDRNRAVNVIATTDERVTSGSSVIAHLEQSILPDVLTRYPGVFYVFEGVQAEQQDAIGGLQVGFGVALFAIFALLAIPLRSYVQPLIIMSAIPFGIVGAVWGHMLMGEDMTLVSMFGLVALTGVVVNDSLVMVVFINRRRQQHVDIATAVREAGVSRFRPILLTSLTTFVGLIPLMLDQAFGTAFIVPMAISLAFGVLFATFITLILVPTSYLILEDVTCGIRSLFRSTSSDSEPTSVTS